MLEHQSTVAGTPSHSEVRDQLTRILSSELFIRSSRLSQFLTFIVEETLAGRGETLKEQTLAKSLYGKSAEFDAAADPIVRVDARRLRDRLREYYATAPPGSVVISVPKGTYTPTFQRASHQRFAAIREVPRRSAPPWWAITAVTMLGLGAAVALKLRTSPGEPLALRLLTVTSFPGWEGQPGISPDGNFVAFARTGPDLSAANDLWVKAVEGDALRRLTDTPTLFEVGPVWSPDGRHIAFFALDGRTSRGVFVVSALGGPARKVADGGTPAWVADSRSLVVSDRVPNDRFGRLALFHRDIETGSSRQLTLPPEGFSDYSPAVSPDGKTLAFARRSRLGPKTAFFLVPMSGGVPVQRTEWGPPAVGIVWTPDGRDLIFSSADVSGSRMYRLRAFGKQPATVVRELPLTGNLPSASKPREDGTFRLAFVYGQADVGLRMIDLSSAESGNEGPVISRFCDSARMESPGRFSRDGALVAFVSNRSGSPQVWVAKRDGSGLRSVTALAATTVNVGAWAPDATAVVFDAVVDGNADIYSVSTEGAPVRRLTTSPATDTDPEWSADGRWIYYASDVSGRSEIWRIPASGVHSQQVTTRGGFEPREGSDRRTVYYVDRFRILEALGPTVTLKQVPVNGGEERVVYSGVRAGLWEVTDHGILFLAASSEPSAGTPDTLAQFDPADGRVRSLATLPFKVARFPAPRLTASRDGRWVLANHLDAWERDIMVAEGFR